MKTDKHVLWSFFFIGTATTLAFSCAHSKTGAEGGPLAKVTSVSDGGAYAEVSRGIFEVGDPVILFKTECKEVPVRGKPWKNCSNLEYGTGRVERRLEDGHLFIRSDAISVPVGAQIRASESK